MSLSLVKFGQRILTEVDGSVQLTSLYLPVQISTLFILKFIYLIVTNTRYFNMEVNRTETSASVIVPRFSFRTIYSWKYKVFLNQLISGKQEKVKYFHQILLKYVIIWYSVSKIVIIIFLIFLKILFYEKWFFQPLRIFPSI